MRRIILIVLIIALLANGSYLLYRSYRYSNIENEPLKTNELSSIEASQRIDEIMRSKYVIDTIYDGEKPLEPMLFDIDFRKSDFYVTNKELSLLVEPNTFYVINDRTKTFVDSIVSSGGIRNYSVEGATYLDNLISNKGFKQELKETLNALVKSDTQIEVFCDSDKSLIWQDLFVYQRGVIRIKVYRTEDIEVVRKLFNDEKINIGEEYEYIFEVALKRDEANNTFGEAKIEEFSIIASIK